MHSAENSSIRPDHGPSGMSRIVICRTDSLQQDARLHSRSECSRTSYAPESLRPGEVPASRRCSPRDRLPRSIRSTASGVDPDDRGSARLGAPERVPLRRASRSSREGGCDTRPRCTMACIVPAMFGAEQTLSVEYSKFSVMASTLRSRYVEAFAMNVSHRKRTPSGNRLLDALPDEAIRRLRPALEAIPVGARAGRLRSARTDPARLLPDRWA